MSRDVELEQQIDAYIKGQLSEEESLKLWERLLKKPEYIELLNTEIEVKSLITDRSQASDKGDDQTPKHELIYRLQNSWKWVAAAAAIVVIAVSIHLFRSGTGTALEDLAVREIHLSENLASAPILRSGQGVLTPGDSLLNLGFKAAIAGDIDRALKVYNTIIRKHPNDPAAVQAYLNKGIIAFNKNQFDKAIASFKKVTQEAARQSFTREKGYWYLGNAYINTDSLTQAREAIYQAYKMKGIYRKPARDLLQKLDKRLGNPPQKYEY